MLSAICCSTHTDRAGKEYTNADSRYATRDAFVVAMEAVTAFIEGPGCYAAAYGMLFQRPWVSTAQILVSTGQLYGTVLYFITSLLEGGQTPHTVLDHPSQRNAVHGLTPSNALGQGAGIHGLSGGTTGSTSCS